MFSLLLLLFISGGLISLIDTKEIYRIVAILFFVPVILYLSVKISKNPSTWSFDNENVTINFASSQKIIPIENIDHVRSLTRSGGNLIEIYQKKGKTLRIWKNKLFQSEDDIQMLHAYLNESPIEFYKL